MEKRTLTYDLREKLRYTKKGNFEETAQLEVDAPSFETLRESAFLTKAFVRGMFGAQQLMGKQDQQSEEQGKIDAGVVKLMLMASDTDFGTVVDAFIDLCIKCCTLDQDRSVKIIKDHFTKIQYDDVVEFACTYIATFIVPSMLSGLQGLEG